MNAALDKSGKLYSIIDGKQRFEAIFRFFKGEIVLATYFVYFNNPTLKLAGLSYQDIIDESLKPFAQLAVALLFQKRASKAAAFQVRLEGIGQGG